MTGKHLLKSFFIVILIFLTVFSSIKAQTAGDMFAAMYIGKSLGTQIGNALASAQKMKDSAAQASAEIETARRRYWQAVKTGRGVPAARAAFARKLAEKDFAYLLFAVPEGFDAAVPTVLRAFASIDGGIAPQAEPEFRNWVAAIRNHLMGNRSGGSSGKKETLEDVYSRARNRNRPPQMIIPTPAQLAAAIQATSKAHDRYLRARDWAEIDRANAAFPWDTDDRAYALMLLQRYGSAQEPREILANYNELVNLFGKESVHRAAAKVRSAPRTPNGRIVGKTDSGMFISLPNSVFYENLAIESPESFFKHLIWQTDNTPPAQVKLIYNRWIDAYGKDFVSRIISEFMERRNETRYGTRMGEKLMYGDAVERFIDESDAKGYVRSMLAHHQQTLSRAQLDAAYNRLVAQHGEKKVLEAAEQLRAFWDNSINAPRDLVKERYKFVDRRADYTQLLSVLQKGINALPGGAEAVAESTSRVVNPEYARWAKYKPGGYARYEVHRWEINRGRKVFRPSRWIEYRIRTVTPNYILYVAVEPSYTGGERTTENVIQAKRANLSQIEKSWGIEPGTDSDFNNRRREMLLKSLKNRYSDGNINLVTDSNPFDVSQSREIRTETIDFAGKRLECATYETNYNEFNKREITLCDGLPSRVFKDIITALDGSSGSEMILIDYNFEPQR